MKNPFRNFNSSPEVIRLTAMMYVRFPLSVRQVEDLLYHFNLDRHLTNRYDFKKNRSAALVQWRQIAA